MERIAINRLVGGEIVAKDIISESGLLVITKGTVIRDVERRILEANGIKMVPIMDDRITISEKEEKELRESNTEKMQEIIFGHISESGDGLREIEVIANNIIHDVLEKKELLVDLSKTKNRSNSTYEHCLCVCGMAVIMGIKMQLSDQALRDIAIGSLIHDIGYVSITKEQEAEASKELADNQPRTVSRHVERGYDMIFRETWMNDTVKDIVYRHHEYCDGSGYPVYNGRVEEISTEVKIVMVCNELDRMIAGHYTQRTSVNDAVERILGIAGTKLDINIVKVFLDCIAVYPNGTYVRLSTGEIAQVIRQNSKMPIRPVIKLIYDKDLSSYEVKTEIDLVKVLDITIIESNASVEALIEGTATSY